MNYKIYLIVLVFFGLTGCTVNSLNTTLPKPNILMIVVDDMSWNGISCYGNKPWKTPNIDKLAEHGMKFTNAYAYPVCSPTRTSIMTGKNPARLRITDWIPGFGNSYANTVLKEKPFQHYLPTQEFTIAEALKKGGYTTAMVGKWHLGKNPQNFPDKQGFDYQYMVSVSNLSQYFVKEDSDQIIGFFNKDDKGRIFLTEHLVDKGIEWFSKPKDKPWFMYFATHVVHRPIAAKNELVQKYLDQGLPAEGVDAADYAAMHKHMDDAIGRLLDYMNKTGLTDNTIIVFLSDNGGREPETVNTPFRGGKGELLEGGIRIPLIFQWKGKIPAGKENHALVITDDLYPTLLSLAGVPLNNKYKLDGISIKNLLLENSKPAERTLFWHYPHYNSHPYGKPSSAIRKGDWKLLELLEDGSQELYNLRADSGEFNNVINENPGIAKELYLELNYWRKHLNVQMPEKNPDYDLSIPSGLPEGID